MDLSTLISKILLASFAATGSIEYLKNFVKTKKTWIYSVLMPVFGIICYLVTEFLPSYAIGMILTIGVVQLDYQIIVQGFKKIVQAVIKKSENQNITSIENTETEVKEN